MTDEHDDRALRRLKRAVENLSIDIQSLKRRLPTGLATERTQTAILNSLEGIKGTLAANSLTLAKIDSFLTKPQIEFTIGQPKDKEL